MAAFTETFDDVGAEKLTTTHVRVDGLGDKVSLRSTNNHRYIEGKHGSYTVYPSGSNSQFAAGTTIEARSRGGSTGSVRLDSHPVHAFEVPGNEWKTYKFSLDAASFNCTTEVEIREIHGK